MLNTIINYDDPKSLYNWVETLDLKCIINTLKFIGESTEVIGMLGSAFFIGWVISNIFVPRLGDIYGRKFIFLIAFTV